jgi:hypothetical protein
MGAIVSHISKTWSDAGVVIPHFPASIALLGRDELVGFLDADFKGGIVVSAEHIKIQLYFPSSFGVYFL